MASKRTLEAIIRREMDNCIGLPGGELSRARESLKEAYFGTGYAADADRREKGWSVYVDRSVMETVEWAKGPLLKVFAGTSDLVRFEPSTSDEEQFAQDATDYVNKVVFGRNAFDLVYGPLTDGLYQRAGWAKAYFDEKIDRVVVGEFDGLSKDEAEAQAAMAEMSGLLADVTQDKDTELYSLRIEQEVKSQSVKVEPLPSERVIYSKDALSIEKARFIAHWEDKMAGELLEEGYSRELVDSLPGEQDNYPETKVQILINSEDAGVDESHRADASRMIRVYEAYVRADDGSGRLVWHKVTYAGDKDKVMVMDQEEWTMYRPPLFAACSLPLPYSPMGMCLADLVDDIQKIRTEMFREVLDNMYLSNHGELHVNEGQNGTINLDQLLSRQPGGVYNSKGEVTIAPLPVGSIAAQALSAIELTDKTKEQRTGIGMTNQGLSADVLQNTATGASILEEAQNIRVEMIARVYGESFYKPMARYVLALAHKYIQQPVMLQRKGQFAEILPAQWNPDMEVSVSVGLGTGNRQKKADAIQQLMGVQTQIITQLGKNSPVRLEHFIRAAHALAESLGFEYPEKYFGTVEDAQRAEQAIMSQEDQPNPEQQKLEIQKRESEQKLALKQQEVQADIRNKETKTQYDAALKTAELQQKGRLSAQEMDLEAQLDMVRLVSKDMSSQGATKIRGIGTL